MLAGAGLAVLALLAGGCGSDDAAAGAGLTVSDARIPEPAGENAALYFTVVNEGEAVEVRSASSAAAPTVVIHETTTSDSGLLEMRELNEPLSFERGLTALAPGGVHAMLIGVDELAVGDVVSVDLELGDGSTLRVEAEVVDAADAVHEAGLDDDGLDGDDHGGDGGDLDVHEHDGGG